MTFPVFTETEAEAEIEEMVRWYERRREGLGALVLAELDDAFRRISERPLAASLLPSLPAELGVRRVLLNRFPYFVAYVARSESIHIVAVGHQHRRPGYYLRRVRRLL